MARASVHACLKVGDLEGSVIVTGAPLMAVMIVPGPSPGCNLKQYPWARPVLRRTKGEVLLPSESVGPPICFVGSDYWWGNLPPSVSHVALALTESR